MSLPLAPPLVSVGKAGSNTNGKPKATSMTRASQASAKKRKVVSTKHGNADSIGSKKKQKPLQVRITKRASCKLCIYRGIQCSRDGSPCTTCVEHYVNKISKKGSIRHEKGTEMAKANCRYNYSCESEQQRSSPIDEGVENDEVEERDMKMATAYQAAGGERVVTPDTCKDIENADELFLTRPSDGNNPTDVTEIEFGQLEILMEQFCHVPFIAEFRQPVAILHPEVSPLFLLERGTIFNMMNKNTMKPSDSAGTLTKAIFHELTYQKPFRFLYKLYFNIQAH